MSDPGVVPPPAVPVVPDVGTLASMMPAALPVPSVPGLPVSLPQAVWLPHDFICAGTAWSALKSAPRADRAAPVKTEVGGLTGELPSAAIAQTPLAVGDGRDTFAESDAKGCGAVRRIMVSSVAVCALAMTMGGAGVAGADPVPDCGPDQATALAIAVAREKHDPLTQAPWSLIPVQSNFDSCADLSAMLVTIDNPRPNSPRQGFLFHRGTYIGTTLANSRPFTTLDTAASTPDTAVFVYTSGRTCATCNDGITKVVHYHWNGVGPVMLEPTPPPQDWPTA